MAKVITFSRTFPKGHPKAGQETNFVQKFWTSIQVPLPVSVHAEELEDEARKLMSDGWQAKHHTIRAGHRWKAGDKFSPRIWSGKPYNSKQLILADDVEIKQVWDIEIFLQLGCIHIGIREDKNTLELLSFGEVAKNDGLTFDEMQDWFDVKPGKPFVGQIICWSDSVNYDKY